MDKQHVRPEGFFHIIPVTLLMSLVNALNDVANVKYKRRTRTTAKRGLLAHDSNLIHQKFTLIS